MLCKIVLGFLFLTLCNTAQSGRWFDRIIIFVFENHSYDEVKVDPNFNRYFKMGMNLMEYYGVTHPSQPNYWCMIGGDHFGINDDDNHNLNFTNIVDLFDKEGITWKAYEENFPGNCYSGAKFGKYYRKHNPFISFDDVRENATRCQNIVNSRQLDIDLASGDLPQYMYFTPNIDDDGHNTNVTYAGLWLHSFLGPRYNKFPPGTLFVITWDEDDYSEKNRIFTSISGSMITAGSVNHETYNHYSLLKTVETNWNLGTLGRNDVNAKSFFSK